jgi:ABC-type multidrug transport system fused ATPase/permease subunit
MPDVDHAKLPPPTATKGAALALLRRLIARERGRFSAYLAGAGVVAVVELLPPRVFRFFSERAPELVRVGDLAAAEFIRSFLAFGAAVAALTLAAQVAWELAQEWMYLRVEASLRQQVLRQVHRVPLAVLGGTARGDWLTSVSADLRGVEHFTAVQLPAQVRGVLVLLGITGMFLWHGGWLAAALLASAAALAGLNVVVQRRLTPVLQELRGIHGEVLQGLLEGYEGTATVRSLGLEAVVAERFRRLIDVISRRGFRLARTTSLVGGGNGFTTGILAAGCLGVVAWRLGQGTLTVAEALLYPFYIGMFYSAALSVVGMVGAWNRFLVDGARIAAFLAASPEAEPAPWSVQTPGTVRFRHLRVIGRGGQPLTAAFDLTLARGRLLLVRGPSGAGKSTLLEVLAGLRPVTAGQVAMEGDLGGDLEGDVRGEYGMETPLRLPLAWSAYVEQRPYLFQGTVRQNLAPAVTGDGAGAQRAALGAEDQRLWEVLRLVNLAPAIRRMGGLDSELKDAGRNLSEGQRYRIGLARALLLPRAFLLVDEPLASLDPESAAAVCAALAGCRSRDQGVVVVSHIAPPALPVDDVLDLGRPGLKPQIHRPEIHAGGGGSPTALFK